MTQKVGFDFVDHRVMAAVQRVASNDPNPADPFRGLYISDETALQLTRGESASGADDRLDAVVVALGLDLLDAAVLATCAARSSTRASAACSPTSRTTSRASSRARLSATCWRARASAPPM